MNQNTILNSLKYSLSYSDYRALIKSLISENKSTGNLQNESRIEFSKLNSKRMDRLDKTLQISDSIQEEINGLKNKFTFLVIAEGWCGDAAQVVPIINKVVDSSPLLSLRIVLRDEHEELMNQFLTNGSKSIPKIIILDKEHQVVNSWGPRPSFATKMVMDYKKINGKIDDELKRNLQLWYNKDKGTNTQKDLLQLLKAS